MSVEGTRIDVLRKLLSSGVAGTQEEICEQLAARGHEVTQSTISRDLRRLGAVKATDDAGRTVYRSPAAPVNPVTRTSLQDLVLSLRSNGQMIVIRTTPGSAPFVAAQIDQIRFQRTAGVLGTIAGDDTIFISPADVQEVSRLIEEMHAALSLSRR